MQEARLQYLVHINLQWNQFVVVSLQIKLIAPLCEFFERAQHDLMKIELSQAINNLKQILAEKTLPGKEPGLPNFLKIGFRVTQSSKFCAT